MPSPLMRPRMEHRMGTAAAHASCRRSLLEARSVTWPAPRELMLARVVSMVLGSMANWLVALAPSATSPFQFMKDAPMVVRAPSAPSSPTLRYVASMLPPNATSPFAVMAPPLSTSFMPSLIFQRSSIFAPYATERPTMEAEMPAEVLLLEAFFQRVSDRMVYASWRPTLWTSRPVVVTTAGVCCMEPSASSASCMSFLSLVTCPETLAGTFPLMWNPLSTLNPSMPLSWSHPCASTMGRTIHWFADSRKRKRWEGFSESNDGGSAGSGAGIATCLGGGPTSSPSSGWYTSSSMPSSSGAALRGLRAVSREESRNGSGGTFGLLALMKLRPAWFSLRLSSALASVRIFEAKQSSSSCGFHTWPLGSTASPRAFLRQEAWFSARDTGFIRRMSPAACRIICCTTCDRCATYMS
mmetsp:Transcript_34304/g.75041  ORF Transcript_34304/g.75041 Transcript_34304/m.75041 type:complete len:412 (-) Transcript_34304:724-1959(-)